MTNYEKITQDKVALIDFLDKYGQFDGSPWMNWFNKNYCEKCEPIIAKDSMSKAHEFCFCELEPCCRFFPGDESVTNWDIIRMWLEEENER